MKKINVGMVLGFIGLLVCLNVPVEAQASLKFVVWSPDGTQFAVIDQGVLHILDASTRRAIQDIQSPVNDFDSVAWSPDGTRIATNTSIQDDGLRVWDAAKGQLLAHFGEVGDSEGGRGKVKWSPNGANIATVQTTTTGTLPVHIWTAIDGHYELLSTIEDVARQVFDIAWSADGTQLAIVDYTGLYLATDLSTDHPTNRRIPLAYGILSVAWRPDGKQIAVSSLVPSGNSLDGKVRIVDIQTAQDVFALPNDSPSTLAWNATGDQLGVSSKEGVNVWNISAGKQTANYPEAGLSFSWSPYGGRLAYLGSAATNANLQTAQDKAVQIVVPAPSIGQLQKITDTCNAPTAVRNLLTPSATKLQLGIFSSRVGLLPAGTIPPACAADLVAVANALQRQ